MSSLSNPKIMVFGGSGNIAELQPFEEPLSEALDAGHVLLRTGQPAVSAVVEAVRVMEDHPRLNAGTGAALTRERIPELEAAVMDGSTRSIGAVGTVVGLANPILVAERIRQLNSQEAVAFNHLVGEGVNEFARDQGFAEINPELLVTDRQHGRLLETLARDGLMVDGDIEEVKTGTVGAVAIDTHGGLAVATSTGGLMGKHPGRIGDTSNIGGGTYADRYAAVSGTGQGEVYTRLQVANTIASDMRYGVSGLDAAQSAMIDVRGLGGRGGVIVVGADGTLASATVEGSNMPHGYVDESEQPVIALHPDQLWG